ncbi:MAG: glutamine--fructose-6-phosphate transaminase (isomerizing) [Clostridia bacterium]|nr:glutamine--fructose-6-phosphate transaminase (isomerizing) [Clostridia bacterium]
MCGIVGYVGRRQAAPILLSGLRKLEYRGYDSAGIAVRNEREIVTVKAQGRLQRLFDKTDNGNAVEGFCGIGHTRWATHGEPSEINAHPHASDDGNVVGVHNGIIENYQELKDKLLRKGYHFYSSTDTEVAIKLVDYYWKKYQLGAVDAINRAMVRIRGSYALAIMFRDIPGEIWVARKDSPLIIGAGDGENFVASDVPAILSHTRSVYYIDNLEIGRLTADSITFYNLDGDTIEHTPITIDWDAEAAEKGGFEHYMLKEIHEQPVAVRETMNSYVHDRRITFEDVDESVLAGLERIYIVGCGSAYHAGLAGKAVLESLTDLPVEIDLASEFRYRDPKLVRNSMVIIISQSGETADSLAALRLAREKGVPVLSVVNVVGSSIARESDWCIYTHAGPEISVATTKAYSAQLIVLYLLAIRIGELKGTISEEYSAELLDAMLKLPDQISRLLEDKERIQWFASKYASARDICFIGRGVDYAISMEGSLKLKEISYIHSEAYAAGELKHGTISLIEDGILVVGILTQQALFEKTVSNMVEVKSRGAYLMAVTSYGNYSIEDTANFCVYIPKTDEHFMASLAVIPLQLLAYYISVAKGLNVDKPRNLAKSVTVE